ncbi:MAG: hypothetical protein V4437_01235 [Patescibacteria group bacterium]
MTKNPILNALVATLYIGIVASVMFFGSHVEDARPTVLVPIAMLSLFSLSAAVMGFIFFYKPILMYVEGEKPAAIKLLMQTIGAFAVITVILLSALVFSKSF